MEWLVQDICSELKTWGHQGGPQGNIIIKCDGETSIQAVRAAVAQRIGGRVSFEGPPKGESQSNGTIEEAGKTVREYARILKFQIEQETKIKIQATDAIMPWIVRWAAMLASRYLMGQDGKNRL